MYQPDPGERLRPLLNLQRETAHLLHVAKADLARGHMSQSPESVQRISDLHDSIERRIAQINSTLSIAA